MTVKIAMPLFHKNKIKMPSLLAFVRVSGTNEKEQEYFEKRPLEAFHSIAEFVQSNSQSGYIEGYQQKRKTSWHG